MSFVDPILIFGGVDGIGGDLARRLTAAGCRIVLTSRSIEKANAFVAGIGLELSRARPMSSTRPPSPQLSRQLRGDGRLGGFVYAVGSIPLKPLAGVTATDLIDAYRLNVVGAAVAVKHAAPALEAAGGSVVLFASVAAAQGFANHAVIGPAKAAVSGLTLALAAALAPFVPVNAIAPSLTRTPLAVARRWVDHGSSHRRRRWARQPSRRQGLISAVSPA